MERSVRHKFRGIFKLAMLLITTLYIVFGVCGYMAIFWTRDRNFLRTRNRKKLKHGG